MTLTARNAWMGPDCRCNGNTRLQTVQNPRRAGKLSGYVFQQSRIVGNFNDCIRNKAALLGSSTTVFRNNVALLGSFTSVFRNITLCFGMKSLLFEISPHFYSKMSVTAGNKDLGPGGTDKFYPARVGCNFADPSY
jgi:hypothetical protein